MDAVAAPTSHDAAPALRVCAHGPLRVQWRDGRQQPLYGQQAGERSARLLALLALERDGVDRRSACNWLWPDAASDTARHALRQLVFRLRRHPVLAAVPLDADGQRMRWAVATDLDLYNAAATPLQRLDALEATAAPLLEGLDDGSAFDEWLLPWRERTRRLWWQCLLATLDGAATLPPERVHRLIDRALELEPFDEAVVRQRLRWLHRHEGPVAARVAYEQWSDRVRDEFGRPAGFDLAPLLVDAPAATPPPAGGTRFVGRDAELAQLDGLLAGIDPARLVCIWGPPGSGKTRLALRWAQQARQRHEVVSEVRLEWLDAQPPGVASTDADAALARAIANACGLPPADARDPVEPLLAQLRGDTRVVVLDNFEHRLADRATLARLVEATPVRWIVTSRTRLGLACEQLLVLRGLQHESGGELPDAQRLFVERALLPQPLDAATREAVDAVCRLAHGQPLALELAARQARRLGVAAVRDALARDPRILVASEPDVPARQRSLEAAFDSVLASLPARLRHDLPRLAVLRGDFDRELAAAALSASPEVLDALVDHSLLAFDSAVARYRWHPFLREFALQALQRDAEAARQARQAAALHVFDTLRRAVLDEAFPDEQALAWVAREWTHVVDAWRTAVDEGRHHWWTPLAEAIALHGEGRASGRESLRVLADLSRPDATAGEAAALAWARVMLLRARLEQWFDSDASLACVDAAAPVFARQRDRRGRVGCLRVRGLVHWRRGHLQQAVACQREALRALGPEQADDRAAAGLRAIVLDGLGLSLLGLGRAAASTAAFEKALAINDRLGPARQTVQNLVHLALDPRPERSRAALHMAERAVALARQTTYAHFLPHALGALAWAQLRQGNLDVARRRGAEAAALAQETAQSRIVSWTLAATARAALGQGDAAAAAADTRRALQLTLALGEAPPSLMHLAFAAEWALAQGDAAWALRAAQACLLQPELSSRRRPELQRTLAAARARLDTETTARLLADAAQLHWRAAAHEALGMLQGQVPADPAAGVPGV